MTHDKAKGATMLRTPAIALWLDGKQVCVVSDPDSGVLCLQALASLAMHTGRPLAPSTTGRLLSNLLTALHVDPCHEAVKGLVATSADESDIVSFRFEVSK